jgi:phage terminase Nu1 subunit (DNA packaging protein)
LVGASLSSVQRRIEAGRLPAARKDAKGRTLINVEQGLKEWLDMAPIRGPAAGDATSTLEAYNEARARREAAEAGLAEDELRKTRGELVEVAGVVDAWVGLITAAKTKLLGIPSKLKQRHPDLPRAAHVGLGELIHEALEDLADSWEAK